jgi:Ca-activated chloride channel family protein
MFLMLWSAWGTAQYTTISGSVTDIESNKVLVGVLVSNQLTKVTTLTDKNGKYSIKAEKGNILRFTLNGYASREIVVKNNTLNVAMESASIIQVVEDAEEVEEKVILSGPPRLIRGINPNAIAVTRAWRPNTSNTEDYAKIKDNGFLQVQYKPLSTFSIDVDKASYSNMRRMINNGSKIPKDAIKVEELINYFNYDYDQPKSKDPIAIATTLGKAPWNEKHQLLKIGLQGKEVPLEDIPASNLVFLIDVSGSMNSPNKLPLLKSAFKVLVEKLRPEDNVSIVVYAGAAGLVLPPTSGAEKQTIIAAIDGLQAGGSTAGSQGINLAYETAEEHFIKNGNNRVIIATDGDFNVGPYKDSEMEDLIVEKRKSGVFLSCLGFGMGNYKDSKIETLADKGNGNYAYIDTMQEAQRVLGTEFGGTMYTIAKDVKLQLEFNPSLVQAYRLIGYENRLLNDEDFKDDTKDAGEMGSGHRVTAFYEIIPTGVKSDYVKSIDSLKYTKVQPSSNFRNELVTIKFRYKQPDEDKSKELVHTVSKKLVKEDTDFNFAAAVAMWGMYLRDSEYLNGATKEQIIALAEQNKAEDKQGYRAEFVRLMKSYLRPSSNDKVD